jgi:hypothetical protein
VVLVTLGGCHLLDGLVACDSVEARVEIVRGSEGGFVRGDYAHPAGIVKNNSSKARGLEDPHLESECAAPAEGLTLDSQLARDPSSGCIATTGTSLVVTK